MKIDFVKMDGVRCGFVDITPKLAEEMLLRNTDNYRKIDKSRVDAYTREMSNGLWRINGEPICFNGEYILTNGQHRLSAIVKSHKTIRAMVVIGLDEKLYDQGKQRTIMQLVKDFDNSTIGAIRFLIKREINAGTSYVGVAETEAMLERFGQSMAEIKKIMSRGSSSPVMKKSPCVAAAWCSCVMNYITPTQLSIFSEIANTGLPVDGVKCDAALLCRRTLQEMVVNNGSTLQNNRFEVTVQSIVDFANKKAPKRKYQPKGNATDIIRDALNAANLLGEVHFEA